MKKWWDYQMFSEDVCDLMFARAWLIARLKFYSRNGLDTRFNEGGEKYLLPLKWQGLQALKNDEETWAGLHGLRLTADKYAIPYPLYWSIAFQVLAETDDWKEEISALRSVFIRSCIVEQINEIKNSRLITSDSPAFSAKAFSGLPLQIEYINWLIEQVKRRHPANYEEKLQVLVGQGKLPQVFA